MKDNTFLLILIFFSIKVYTQNQRTTIYGNIRSDIKQLEDIHIINKSTHNGTITDTKGRFQVFVKENDTLIFSGIQFYYLEIILTKLNIDNKTITVDLFQKINVLDEVTIEHHLLGNLTLDAKNIKDSISMIGNGVLNFGDIDLNLVGNVSDNFSRSRTSNNSQLMPNMSPNLIAIASLILSPVVKQIGKIGATKRNMKKYERNYKANILAAPEKIRADFGDVFFTETLKIPTDKIDDFIVYCLPKGIANLYVDNKKIELIELLLEESKVYNIEIINDIEVSS